MTTAIPTKPSIKPSDQPLMRNMSRDAISRLFASLLSKPTRMTPAESRLADHAVAAVIR
jgi:hypothetical protein